MTDKDYIAISNTGKNITITMTPGMKQRVLGSHGRIRLRLGVDNRLRAVVLVPCGPGHGYQMIRRKNVWNMSVSSKRFQYWPKHERIVLNPSQVDMTEHGAIIMLPKPSAPIPDKPIATPKKWLSGPIPNQTEARFLFKTPDMVVAAITGACFGFLVVLVLMGAGVLS